MEVVGVAIRPVMPDGINSKFQPVYAFSGKIHIGIARRPYARSSTNASG